MTGAVAPPVAGIDVGGTKCLGLVLDRGGDAIAEHRLPTPDGEEHLVETLTALVGLLRADVPDVAAVGVGIAGLIQAPGVVRFSANLPGVVELPLHRRLADAAGLPVVVDNDATCAAVGEAAVGGGGGAADAVLITLGTGIGGGLVRGGRVDRGAHGFAGEVGHMIVHPDGPSCPCGQRGCWERFASGSALGDLGRDVAAGGGAPRLVDLAGGDAGAVRGEHVTTAAAAGDAPARAVLDRYGWWVALGLANLANVLDPAVIVLGGGVVESGDLVLGPTRAAFGTLVHGGAHRPEIPIVAATLGEHAGAIGAALLAREIFPR